MRKQTRCKISKNGKETVSRTSGIKQFFSLNILCISIFFHAKTFDLKKGRHSVNFQLFDTILRISKQRETPHSNKK